MDITVVDAVTKTIGSLALSFPYLRRLGFADLIDDLTTKGKEREVSTGRVVEVLVLNRLSLRQPDQQGRCVGARPGDRGGLRRGRRRLQRRSDRPGLG